MENAVTVGSHISYVSHLAVSDQVSLPPSHHAHSAQQQERNPDLSIFKCHPPETQHYADRPQQNNLNTELPKLLFRKGNMDQFLHVMLGVICDFRFL